MMKSKLVAMMVLMSLVSAWADEYAPVRSPLFHIERNKNANIVQYDALHDTNGNLRDKDPIDGYWIRHAEQGQVKALSWAQKKFAYGYKIQLNTTNNTARMDMAANIGRSITVLRVGDDYRAMTEIDGVESYLDRIFIHSSGKGLSTKVDYIELFGLSAENQQEQYERFVP